MSLKRIALVGNMNNSFFAIARHLRDRGYEAHVFYRNMHEHFHPQTDTLNLSDLDFCHQVNDWGDAFHDEVLLSKIYNSLKGFDFFIGMGTEATMAYKAGIHFNIYIPYGSDIYLYAHQQQNYPLYVMLMAFFKINRKVSYADRKKGTSAAFLKNAIANADYVLWDNANDEVDEKLKAIGLEGKLIRTSVPFVYPKQYINFKDSIPQDIHWGSFVNGLRTNNDFLMLYHGRQEWVKPGNEFESKHTHYLIEGFAKFLAKKPAGFNAKLLMLEYGFDVDASKELIKKLNIEKDVQWFPKMYRKDIMYILSKVNLACGEFNRSYISFGTIIEAMSIGVPIIHHREDALYVDSYESLYPMINAKTPQEIADALTTYAPQPEKLKQMGAAAKIWVDKYFIDQSIEKIVNIIEKRSVV
jgi:glycosyltransferase involved in cell wall biosynthesis